MKNMRLCYLLLTIWVGHELAGHRGVDAEATIKIAGTGTMANNGKTSLNINVEIAGNPVIGGLQPGAGGQARIPGGRIPGQGGAGPTPPTATTQLPTYPTEGTTPGGTPTGQGVGASGEFTEEELLGLGKHNDFRQIHQVPLMTLDRGMCDEAKQYAEKLASMGVLQHSSPSERSGEGENLSMGCSSDKAQSMEEAVTNWYNEVCDPGYTFSSGGFSGGTGHFTQVVWKESVTLGIGRAETTGGSGMKCGYIVGRYRPAGNMMGDFQENVLKGNFNKNYCNSIKKRKYYDQNGKEVSPVASKGVAQYANSHVPELLNSKKKKKHFVGITHQ